MQKANSLSSRELIPSVFSACVQADKGLVINQPCDVTVYQASSKPLQYASCQPANLTLNLTHSSSKRLESKAYSVSTPEQRYAAASLYTFIVTNQKSYFHKFRNTG